MTDWEAEGLLDGLDGEAREARAELLDMLSGDGVPLAELRAAAQEERLVLLPLERTIAGRPRYTADEVAERTGFDRDTFLAYRRAYGLAVPALGEVAYSDEDVEDAERGKALLDAGIPAEDLIEVERVLGMGIARYAEAFRTTFAQAFLRPGDSEADVARRYSEAADLLRPLAGPHLAQVFLLHLRQHVRTDVISSEERQAGQLMGRETTAVAFADLVGFTELGESLGHEELGGVASRLAGVTQATIGGRVRLVKTIGDAVMLIAPEPRELVEACLDLIETGEAEGLPALRAGVACGPAVNRWGDWYGSTVNLASRLTTRARPGSVLTTEAVQRQAGEDGLDWSFAGEKKLKGFSSDVKAFRARRAGARAPE